jgi:leader peptidase (prepilin peptidase) / N-methyltransferase
MQNLAVVGLTLTHLVVFAIGASVGSFLNVCAYRIPYERSFLWPGSHCGSCYKPVRWFDNLPLLSYWLLRGRCRTCGARFSIRYFFVELFTGLAFLGLYYLEIDRNVLGIHFLNLPHIRWEIDRGMPSRIVWAVFLHHAVLMSFLIAASLCDLDHLEIPLGITVAGTIVGLICSACFPWPFPDDRTRPPMPVPAGMGMIGANPEAPIPGLYAWPAWYPFPNGCPAGSWQLGLVTGLAGAAAGNVVLRAVRFLFGVGRGIEGLGIGDADLMMMAGSFVGWQVILVAFAAGVFPALLVGVVQVISRGKQAMPFGPSLAIGVMVTVLCWHWIAPRAWLLLSDSFMLTFFGVACPVLFVAVAFLLRIVRGPGPPDEPPDESKGSRKDS